MKAVASSKFGIYVALAEIMDELWLLGHVKEFIIIMIDTRIKTNEDKRRDQEEQESFQQSLNEA